jgi:hypothetical protein
MWGQGDFPGSQYNENGRGLANLDEAPSSKDAADFVQFMTELLERQRRDHLQPRGRRALPENCKF